MNYQDRIDYLLGEIEIYMEDKLNNNSIYAESEDYHSADYHIEIISAIDTSNLSNSDKETISDLECYYNIS